MEECSHWPNHDPADSAGRTSTWPFIALFFDVLLGLPVAQIQPGACRGAQPVLSLEAGPPLAQSCLESGEWTWKGNGRIISITLYHNHNSIGCKPPIIPHWGAGGSTLPLFYSSEFLLSRFCKFSFRFSFSFCSMSFCARTWCKLYSGDVIIICKIIFFLSSLLNFA